MTKLLWNPSPYRIRNSNLLRFIKFINKKYHLNFDNYTQLYEWSIENIPEFWASFWEFVEIIVSKPYHEVIDDIGKMPGARWFSGARLNFAENLLRYQDDQIALIFRGESRIKKQLTYAELYDAVARVAESLRKTGVQPGDKVVGFMPNMPETIIAMLAATSRGATWSSCSPDFGIKGVLDRFGQIKPKLVFTANGYFFKGKWIDSLERIGNIIEKLPSVEKLVVISYTEEEPDIGRIPNAVHYEAFRSTKSNLKLQFEQLPFSHPLYIMYSSGTTGLPKCMVQSAGGVLIQQLKDLILATDLKREDTIFYFTTAGWMMWNWLTTSLAVGATLILYDGDPFYPDPEALWKIAQDEKISIFGTSAGYLGALQDVGGKPGEHFDLSALQTVLSTGSPLSIESFEYVYQEIKSDIMLASITGGSDLNATFAAGNPMEPVYAGEIQCRGLGMKVEAFDETGKSIINHQGELVCTAPFPSMPIYFWDDADGRKYHKAYFDVYPGIWRHGDYIEVNDRGGVIIYGRSDATLNPGGVRIGTAEIYRQMEQLPEIEDSLVIGQNWQNDVRVVLFVKMAAGFKLTDDLKAKIRTTIRTNASPRHVPRKVIEVPAIPYTLNMKKVELAVKKIIEGQPVLNKDALSNPEALDYYADLQELQED